MNKRVGNPSRPKMEADNLITNFKFELCVCASYPKPSFIFQLSHRSYKLWTWTVEIEASKVPLVRLLLPRQVRQNHIIIYGCAAPPLIHALMHIYIRDDADVSTKPRVLADTLFECCS